MSYAKLYGEKQFHSALERDYPWVEWRTPVRVSAIKSEAGSQKIGCRYCIAAYGLKCLELDKTAFLFETEDEFSKHLLAEHPILQPDKEGKIHVH